MSTMKLSAKGGGDFFRLRFWATALLLLGISLMLCMGEASALAPAAGSSIGNQASATYTDGNNVSRITVSNAVTTVVAQVYSATLVQSQTRTGAPGQPITFAHSITNSGNGADTYTIGTGSFATGSGALAAVPLLYADANCDGVADNTTVITQVGPVPANSVACFVAQGTLSNAGGATPSTFNVNATSVGSPGAPAIASNTDSANVASNGVINISKSVSTNSGPGGTTVTYTLTYRNTGTVAVSGLVIGDTLQSGVTFAPALNATVNGTVVAATTAAANGNVTTSSSPRSSVAVGTATGTTRTIVFVLDSVPANSQGTVSFQAQENGGPVNYNVAQFCYGDGAGGTVPSTPAGTATACNNIITGSGATTGTTSGTYLSTVLVDSNLNSGTGILTTNNPNTTNTVPFTVITGSSAAGLVLVNDGTTSAGGGDGTAGGAGTPVDGGNPSTAPAAAVDNTTAGVKEDFNVVASAAQGATITFSNWVWNTGNASDSYNVRAVTNNFPTGTSFLYLRSDGNTPLTDSDGDGRLDTGPIAGLLTSGTCPAGSPNTTPATGACGYRLVVKAILPANATGAGPFGLVLEMSSSATPTAVNRVTDVLSALSASKVDLLNPRTTTGTYAIGATGTCPGATDVTPNPGTPNAGVTCTQYTNNGGTGQTVAGEAAFITSISANPGTTVIYKLDVKNDVPAATGSADSYDLTYAFGTANAGYSRNTTTGVITYGAPNLPQAGYAVNFYIPTSTDCSGTFGSAVSNTGVIAPGATKLICAVVTIPSNANATTATGYDLYFRAVSPTTITGDGTGTGTSADVIRDRLVINSFRSISLTPNGNGQVFPGGSITYCHTLTNLGNVVETGALAAPSNVASPAAPAWPANATVYANPSFDCQTPSGAPLTGAGLNYSVPIYNGTARSNMVNYLVVVQAPSNATAGQSALTSLTATPNAIANTTTPAPQTATDSTTVVVGQVTLVKSQVLDTGCTAGTFTAGTLPPGAPAAAFTSAQIAAKPGECIVYQVVATNIGTTQVSGLQIFDATPPNTTCYGTPWYVPAGQPVASGTALTAGTNYTAGACTPGTNAATNFNTSAQTLNSNQSTTLYMRVRVNQ